MKTSSNIFGNIAKFTTRFTPGAIVQTVFTPENLRERKIIEKYLTVYNRNFYTTIYGDIVITTDLNTIDGLTLRAGIAKLLNKRPDALNISRIPTRGF